MCSLPHKVLASSHHHFPKSPPTFCVGAHCTNGNGWLPAESPSAANHLADGEAPPLSTRLPGSSSARKGSRSHCVPSTYGNRTNQHLGSCPSAPFCSSLLCSAPEVQSTKQRPRGLLCIWKKETEQPSNSASNQPARVMSEEDQAHSEWLCVSVRTYTHMCLGVHE